MYKEAYYFPHDSNARNDERLLAVRMKYKWEGYGLYFALVEKLRESSNYECVKDYNVIAFDLQVGADKIKSLVEDFGLFTISSDGKKFFSESLKKRMLLKDEKSEKARESAEKRWENERKKQENANVMRTHSDGNAKKRNNNIVKEKKERESKERNVVTFVPPTPAQVENFFKEKKPVWKQEKCKTEAEKFVGRYAGVGWVIGKYKTPVTDWESVASKWIETDKEFETENGMPAKKNVAAAVVQNHQSSEPTKEPTPEQRVSLAKNTVLKAFQDYTKHGFYEDYGNTVYNVLSVTLNVNYFTSFIGGKDSYYDGKGAEKIKTKGKGEVIDMKNGIMKAIEDTKLNGTPREDRSKIEGKKVAVTEFFQHLKELEMNIEDLLI